MYTQYIFFFECNASQTHTRNEWVSEWVREEKKTRETYSNAVHFSNIVGTNIETQDERVGKCDKTVFYFLFSLLLFLNTLIITAIDVNRLSQ